MRLFLAVDLPDPFRAALGTLRERLAPAGPGWRWVEARSVHLTLRFLGEVDPEEEQQCREAWRAAVASVERFRFGAGSVGQFPPRGRPRVLWLELRDDPAGSAAALAARLETAARRCGFVPEERAFRGHLTLARARRGGRARRPSEVGVPAELRDQFAEVTDAVLFRSDLRPDGPRYTALERFPLASSGRDGEQG